MKLTNQPHVHDAFDDLNDVMQVNANLMEGPIYTVGTENLWTLFLENLPKSERGFHTCRCCRHFVERFGGMYTVDSDGVHRTIWTVEAPTTYRKAVAALEQLVLQRASRDDKLALIDDDLKGTKSWTGHGHTGQFSHFHLTFNRQTKKKVTHYAEASERTQYVAAKFGKHLQALEAAAVNLADSRVTATMDFVTRWFAANGFERRNLLAGAHDGLTHWNSSVLGSMVDDLAAGNGQAFVVSRAREKLGPLTYQRPQTVSEGQIAAAEKLFAERGWAASLQRRNLLPSEIPIQAHIWVRKGPQKGGASVFSHVQPSHGFSYPTTPAETKVMSWHLFVRSILPKAHWMAVDTTRFSPATLTTAVNPKAPPILRYDKPEQRHPVAWWMPAGPVAGQKWSQVAAVLHGVPQWFDRDEPTHKSTAVLQLVDYCNMNRSHSGLFPELLSHELREVRHVVEAHNYSAPQFPTSEGVTCVKSTADRWVKLNLLIETTTGTTLRVEIDRYE